MKCCATEFNLPISGLEKEYLTQNFPEYRHYLQSTEKGSFILRGNSCPFLTTAGLCQLHAKSIKPLTCRIYPLIFWRFNQKDTLVSIHPCRGHGFQWYSRKKSSVGNSFINQLLSASKEYYDTYWGEEIDANNPYEGISQARIKDQLEAYRHTSKDKLLVTNLKNPDLSSRIPFSQAFQEKALEIIDGGSIGNFLNSVFNWLIWSPVGLHLSIKNAQTLFTTAALWLIDQTEVNSNILSSIPPESQYYEQTSSFYASSLTPSFWENILAQKTLPTLSTFAEKVRLILMGELPQDDLLK